MNRDLMLLVHPVTKKIVQVTAKDRPSRSEPSRHWCKLQIAVPREGLVTIDMIPLEMN